MKYSGGDPSSSGMILAGEGERFISKGDGNGLESFEARCGIGAVNVWVIMANRVKYILPFGIQNKSGGRKNPRC